MKKIAAFILALIYLTISTGATVHLHYCMGKWTGKGLLHESSGKCDKCGMEKNKANGCCKDESRQLKIENDQNIPGSESQTLKIPHTVPSGYTVDMPVIYQSCKKETIGNHSPPPKSQVPLFIRNCVFLI